jgi:hypothetical protein
VNEQYDRGHESAIETKDEDTTQPAHALSLKRLDFFDVKFWYLGTFATWSGLGHRQRYQTALHLSSMSLYLQYDWV